MSNLIVTHYAARPGRGGLRRHHEPERDDPGAHDYWAPQARRRARRARRAKRRFERALVDLRVQRKRLLPPGRALAKEEHDLIMAAVKTAEQRAEAAKERFLEREVQRSGWAWWVTTEERWRHVEEESR